MYHTGLEAPQGIWWKPVHRTEKIWVTIAFITPPTDAATLRRYYERVRPWGKGWAPFRTDASMIPGDSLAAQIAASFCGVVMTYGALFGLGFVMYGNGAAAIISWLMTAAALAGLVRLTLRRRSAA